MIVAVDGPSGAGKSTVCREAARRLGFQLVDTGALYRAVTLAAMRADVPIGDEERLGELAAAIDVRFEPSVDGQRVLLDGEDVTDAIRTAEVSRRVSPVAAHPSVRAALLERQRELGTSAESIVEGRDIGTVVFPDADLKVFYTASVEARARRRMAELERRGEPMDEAEVRAEIEARDERDRERTVAPLRRAPGAVLLDTSDLDFEGATEALIALIERARRAPSRPQR